MRWVNFQGGPGHARTCRLVDIGLLKVIQQGFTGTVRMTNGVYYMGYTLGMPGEYD